jgi:HEAT repeat protein
MGASALRLERWLARFLSILVVAAAGWLSPWVVWADTPVEVTLPESIAQGLASPDPQARSAAVLEIQLWGNPAALPVLLKQLADPDQKVGLYAAQTLGELASPENLPVLRAAMRSPNPNVRWRVALALGDMGDRRAIPTLARALKDDEVLVHRTAAESLVKLGGPAAASALVRALDDGRPSVVNAAMNGLITMGAAGERPLIIALYNENGAAGTAPELRRRHNAATTLGYIGTEAAVPALVLAASDPDPAIREEAQWALSEIKKRTARTGG